MNDCPEELMYKGRVKNEKCQLKCEFKVFCEPPLAVILPSPFMIFQPDELILKCTPMEKHFSTGHH